jgi:membrane-associated phospholipid phosphatase
MPRDNIFTQLIANLYQTDTSTNIWPSIHVYNSIGAHLGVATCEALKKHKGIQIGSLILCISIILSTMFIKQHSAFDVLTALVLAGFMHTLVYDQERSLVIRFSRMLRKGRSKAQSTI